MAVNVLSGLPNAFTARITAFATEFEIEYTALGVVDGGINNVTAIREHVLRTVRALSDDREDAVDDAIGGLVEKQILARDGETGRAR
jgi:hypothetical protein